MPLEIRPVPGRVMSDTHPASHPVMLKRLALIPLLAFASGAVFAAEERPLIEWDFQKLFHSLEDKSHTVKIPHTWNAADSSRKDYYRGPAVYSRELGPGEAFAGKRVFIRCEAVSTVAEIILNGKIVGEHRGGFTEFGFELTPYLDAKGKNLLEVRANNAWRADVAPLGMDFSIQGGMYRPVSLVLCDTVCLNPVVDGTRGVTMTYGKATKENASVTVTATVNNGGASAAPAKVRFTLLDKAGAKVAEVVKEISAAPGDTRVSGELILANPHLWNGVKDPYLYSTEVTVEVAGKTTDTLRRATGFRDIRIDAKKGLFLNGEHLRLNGVNRHQDWEGIGWALTPEQHRIDAEMIREMGANAVRLAHYPHAREFLDECDRLGLLVWAEIPFTNSAGVPSQHPGLEANVVSQLRELIRQQGGHASIFCWSLYNELGMSATVDYLPLVRTLQRVSHEEDPTRPTAGATCVMDKNLCAITDLVGFNSYPGWYYDSPDKMQKFITGYAKAAPDKPWAVSEYGAGAAVKHHEPNIDKKPGSGGKWHPEEWQARVHEGNYATFNENPQLWGTFLWNMFDFASTGKNEGERDGINDKGMVTRDRKTRKDSFYFYQANWSEKPVLRLASHRAFQPVDKSDPKAEPRVTGGTRMTGDTLPIRLYSNLTDIRVKFNGEELPAPEAYAPHAYATKPVKLRPGKNTVEASAKTKDGATVTDSVEWDPAEKTDVPPVPASKPKTEKPKAEK